MKNSNGTSTQQAPARSAKPANKTSARTAGGGSLPVLTLVSERPAVEPQAAVEPLVTVEPVQAPAETPAPAAGKAPKVRLAPAGWVMWVVDVATKSAQRKVAEAVKESGLPAPAGTRVHLHQQEPGKYTFVVAKFWQACMPDGAYCTSEADALAVAAQYGWDVKSGFMPAAN